MQKLVVRRSSKAVNKHTMKVRSPIKSAVTMLPEIERKPRIKQARSSQSQKVIRINRRPKSRKNHRTTCLSHLP